VDRPAVLLPAISEPLVRFSDPTSKGAFAGGGDAMHRAARVADHSTSRIIFLMFLDRRWLGAY
jgi:hypothetical protein